MWEWLWAGLAVVLTPTCSCSPSSVSCLMLKKEPTPTSGVHPSLKPPPLGDSGGPLAVTCCAWSDPRPLPLARFFLSPRLGAQLLTVHLPRGWGALGGHRVGQGGGPGRKGDRCEHPRSPASAAVMGTPAPSTSPLPFLPPFPPPSGFFVSTVLFLFCSPFFPFHREIKV